MPTRKQPTIDRFSPGGRPLTPHSPVTTCNLRLYMISTCPDGDAMGLAATNPVMERLRTRSEPQTVGPDNTQAGAGQCCEIRIRRMSPWRWDPVRERRVRRGASMHEVPRNTAQSPASTSVAKRVNPRCADPRAKRSGPQSPLLPLRPARLRAQGHRTTVASDGGTNG